MKVSNKPFFYKTVSLNKASSDKRWLIVDADSQVLGRLASNIAFRIRGKHKPGFTPHVDCGDNIVVINAEKVRLTGNKMKGKQYISHTGYPGGQKTTTPSKILEKHPTRLIERAVKGMLPKNRLGRELFRNLYVYEGASHPHAGQKPEFVSFT